MTFVIYSKQNDKNSFKDSTKGFKHFFLQKLTDFAFLKLIHTLIIFSQQKNSELLF